MLPEGTIQATNVWKRFRADRRRALFRDELQRFRASRRGDGQHYWRWALKDVTFVAEPGESIGIMGANGSGKSTLLKILTRVMYPYAGNVETSGRVGALIELRAGIHPDLTGRENIFLYGSLMGHDRQKMAKRFDEIVAFAELEEAVDRQVKFYSSGMSMRLGFAVAALLEPDILLVDEVLAVGDAAFQQRCQEKMRSLLAEGTTLVFVSHDLPAVEATCGRGLWLHQGVVEAEGPVREVLAAYRRSVEEYAESIIHSNDLVRLLKATVTGDGDGPPGTQEPLDLSFVVESLEERPAKFHLGVSEGTASPVFSVGRDLHLPKGETRLRVTLPRLPLGRGKYYLWLGIYDVKDRDLLAWQPISHFEVAGPEVEFPPRAIKRLAPVHVEATWEVGGG